jgi:ADP-heptose:LPS heptosyltransferase/glycosyltransferase involved in cell wall biosynthesis
MNLVCFGQQNWHHCWTGKQHLMTRLARRGHRVLYVDPRPLDVMATADERACPPGLPAGVREVEAGVKLFTYLRPARGHFLPDRRWRSGALVRRAAQGLGIDAPVVLALRPDVGTQMRAIDPVAQAYYAVDEWTGFAGLSDAWRVRMRAYEEELLRHVDLALAVSPRLAERFATLQPRTELLPNGADLDHFAPERIARLAAHASLRDLPGPRLGFIGQIDDRVDQDLLVAIARARPDWQIVLVGRIKGVDVGRLAALTNVTILGYQPYDELPRVLRDIDVCLVPYQSTPLTQSCNPLKVFEYLASGRPVVSTPLEGLFVHGDAVIRAAGADEFIRAIDRALAHPTEGLQERLAVARANSWEDRADRLEALLEDIQAEGRRVRARPSRGRVPSVAERRNLVLTRKARVAYAALNFAGTLYYAARVAVRRLRGVPHADTRRILIARNNCDLGDLIAFLPTLTALRARYPEAHIVLAAQPAVSGRALVEGGLVDEIRTLSHLSEQSARRRLAGTVRLFLEGFDLVVSGASYYLTREPFFTGSPRRIGLDEGLPLQSLNTAVVPMDLCRHEAENNLAILELIGIHVDDSSAVPEISAIRRLEDVQFHQLAAGLGLDGSGRIVTVHAGSKKLTRRWPVEHFAELVGNLLTRHAELQVALSGVASEVDLVEAVRIRLPEQVRMRAVNVAGRTGLSDLVALVDGSAAVVSNDTGLMHLARARNVPLVAVLGPENDRRWGPYPRGTAPVLALRHVVPCAPCRRRTCEDLYCLRALTVAEVLESTERLLAGEVESAFRRVVTRHTWQELASMGHAVPRVSAVVPVMDAADARRLLDTVISLDATRYPLVDVVVAIANGIHINELTDLASHAGVPIRCVSVESAESQAVWEAGADAARGDWLIRVSPGETWSGDRLADRVAEAVREWETFMDSQPTLDRERLEFYRQPEAGLRPRPAPRDPAPSAPLIEEPLGKLR